MLFRSIKIRWVAAFVFGEEEALWQLQESCRFMLARAAQRVGRSVTSSTMWPIQRKQIMAGSSQDLRVTAERLMQRSF